ncbi:MAG TPA: lysylphosphatidylglycerol synthase domain-containing protein [Rhizomicrobium sp.]|nr:lysylphosphatidylglycerol synthase domain-containing protein [Rhizomicrobium sp.]
MKKLARLLLLGLGFGLLLVLLSRLDVGAVLASLRHVGWLGFGLVVLAGLALTACLASGLYPLLGDKGSVGLALAVRQLRDSAGDILPFTQIGGIALGMRVMALGGIAAPRAMAVGVVDVTTELMAQSMFVLIGLELAAPAIQADPHLGPYLDWLRVAALLFAIGIAVFAYLQLSGSRLAERTLGTQSFGGRTALFREAIHHLYRQRGRVALSFWLHLIGWCASGLWLWLVFRVLGVSIAPTSAIAIQSLLEALRSAAVFVPAALGVQEAGYAALVPLFGLSPETGVAVSVLRRARDIAVGIPALLAWQLVEARRVRERMARERQPN